MFRRYTIVFIAAIATAAIAAHTVRAQKEGEQWIALFDGSSLDGWTISDTNHHGDTQDWKIVDGAIVGTQDKTGNGGIIYYEREFDDFVLEIELNPDWGIDSGIFLRSTPKGECYQILVDNYDGGSIGGIYGEATGGFYFPNREWLDHIKKDEWNKVVAVVQGNPPTIDVWLNGNHACAFQDTEKRLPDEGHIALQVHAGDKFDGLKTRYRNIRIREL